MYNKNLLPMDAINSTKKSKASNKWKAIRKKLYSLAVMVSVTLSMSMTAFAAGDAKEGAEAAKGTDIWVWAETAMKDVYDKFLGVSTIAACLSASICLILMYFSTDDRAVSSSRAWLKRILISWIVLNVLGFIMTYLTTLTNGGRYVG